MQIFLFQILKKLETNLPVLNISAWSYLLCFNYIHLLIIKINNNNFKKWEMVKFIITLQKIKKF